MLAVLPTHTLAKNRRGAELVIQSRDGSQVSGELIAVKKHSLLLLDSSLGADRSVPFDQIVLIHILKGSRAGLGALSGLLVGGLIGTAASQQDDDCNKCPEDGGSAVYGGILLGGVGALVGALVGNQIDREEIIVFQGMPPDKREEFLKKLRKKARIPDIR